MIKMFGEKSHNELFSARNRLLLWTDVEHKFYKFQISIVLARSNDTKSWKLSLLKQDILCLSRDVSNVTWKNINNKELQFKG
jgi:hypothetical protein